MVLVTDKQYYMERALKDKLDMAIKRNKKNFDHLWILDGDEGYGKSTFALQLGYYIAHETGKPFSSKNVFFDLEEMLKFAADNEDEIIIWDEAALGGMAAAWQSKIQQKLIQILMTARKKRHFWFFLIPKYHKLNEYIVVDRSIGLIHVYSHDQITRGRFTYYDKKLKEKLYDNFRRTRQRNYSKKYSFLGRFFNKEDLIDMSDYEKRKDQAIKDVFKDEGSAMSGKNLELAALKYYIVTYFKLHRDFNFQEMRRELSINDRVLNDWYLNGKKNPAIHTTACDKWGGVWLSSRESERNKETSEGEGG